MLSEALDQSRDPDWNVRKAAAGLLGQLLDEVLGISDDGAARDRLTELLDDQDTAVGSAAAGELLVLGGLDGAARVARAIAYGDGDSADHIYDTLQVLRQDGFPLDERINDLVATAVDDKTNSAARVMAEYLGVRPRSQQEGGDPSL